MPRGQCQRKPIVKLSTTPKSEPITQKIRSFDLDNRSNPGLHNLHVALAYQTLKIAKEAYAALSDLSQVQAMNMAQALHEVMAKEIEINAAYFEAATLLFAGLEPPIEPE